MMVIMSAPAALMISRLMVPKVRPSKPGLAKTGSNTIDTSTGLPGPGSLLLNGTDAATAAFIAAAPSR